MAASSALFIVCLSGSDSTLILMTSSSVSPGKIAAAPRVGLPVTLEPSVYTTDR